MAFAQLLLSSLRYFIVYFLAILFFLDLPCEFFISASSRYGHIIVLHLLASGGGSKKSQQQVLVLFFVFSPGRIITHIFSVLYVFFAYVLYIFRSDFLLSFCCCCCCCSLEYGFYFWVKCIFYMVPVFRHLLSLASFRFFGI